MKNTLTIWTVGHRPFVIGGTVEYVLKTTVNPVRRFTYRGFRLAVVEDSFGNFRPVEVTTGALVGDGHASADEACAAVIADIKGASLAVMRKQIEEAKAWATGRTSETKEAAEFWAMLPSNSGKAA